MALAVVAQAQEDKVKGNSGEGMSEIEASVKEEANVAKRGIYGYGNGLGHHGFGHGYGHGGEHGYGHGYGHGISHGIAHSRFIISAVELTSSLHAFN